MRLRAERLFSRFYLFKLVTVFFLLTFTTIFLSQTAFGQQQGGKLDLSISPVFFDFTANPGDTVKDKIRVRNNANASISLKVELKKLTASNTQEADIADLSAQDEFAKWIQIDNSNFEAKPQEWVEVPFTINIPKEAAFGYYFAFTITQDTTAPSAQNKPTEVIQGSVAVPVLLNVKSPNAIAKAELVEFKPKSFINEFLPVDFEVKLKNSGNVHLKPRGNIFVRGSGEKELAILEVNESMSTILPQGSRTFETSWNDGFFVNKPVDKNGQNKREFQINWNKLTAFRFGPYTANMLLVYDDGTKDVPIEGSVTFWVLPWKMIVGSLVIIIGIIFGIKFLLQSYVKAEMRKQRK